MSISTICKSRIASEVSFTAHKMIILLEDGREVSVPLDWFPSLRDASMDQLLNWRFIGNGEGIHWEELDEDVSVERLLD